MRLNPFGVRAGCTGSWLFCYRFQAFTYSMNSGQVKILQSNYWNNFSTISLQKLGEKKIAEW